MIELPWLTLDSMIFHNNITQANSARPTVIPPGPHFDAGFYYILIYIRSAQCWKMKKI
jgi:hypothetical protein